MKISMSKSAIALSCAAALGLSISGGVVAFASDQGPAQQTVSERLSEARMPNDKPAGAVTDSWPKNEFGLTYGYATPADVEAGNLPDLRPFQPTPDGPGGFLRNEETYLPAAKTTEEEIARTKAMYNEKGEEVRNLYGPDGKTVLDTFVYSTITLTDEDGQTLSPKTGKVIDRK